MSTPFPLDLQPHWRLPSDLGYGPDNPPDGYILGDVWVTRHREGPCSEYITVDKDPSPLVLIGDELLQDIQFDRRRYMTCAWVRLEENEIEHESVSDCQECDRSLGDPARPPYCFRNMLLHIDARNRHLVYRIGNYRPQSRTWEAAWPD